MCLAVVRGPAHCGREVDQAVRIAGPGGWWVSDDRSQLDMHRVHAWISRECDWAAGRSHVVMTRAVEHSLALGLYAADGDQAGFARLVTDRATFAWLCDLFVDPVRAENLVHVKRPGDIR